MENREYTDSGSNQYDNPPVTLKDIIQKIIRARWWIFSAIVIVFIGTAYVVSSTPPTYQATASIIIEQSSKAQAIFNFGNNNNFKISDEIAVIKSRTIAEDVVKSLWESNKRNRLYVFGTKVFVPRGQRLRRPLKKIFSLRDKRPDFGQRACFPMYKKRIFSNIRFREKVFDGILYLKLC